VRCESSTGPEFPELFGPGKYSSVKIWYNFDGSDLVRFVKEEREVGTFRMRCRPPLEEGRKFYL